MKLNLKIKLFNMLTVVFALLLIISIGGLTSGVPVWRVASNIFIFSYLTSRCYIKEQRYINTLKTYRRKLRNNVIYYPRSKSNYVA